jgi:hypothetical protein
VQTGSPLRALIEATAAMEMADIENTFGAM